jgi:hypothetical protein
MKRFVWHPLQLIVLVAAGYGLTYLSFSRIETLRRIERIPQVQIQDLIPAEANITGQAQQHEQTLRAPRTQQTCFAYRYTIHERTRDADGDTKWSLVSSQTQVVPFLINDGSGEALIALPPNFTPALRQSYTQTVDDRRYTEYRIDPGATVFAMGVAARENGKWVLRFDASDTYEPSVSTISEAERRGSVGLFSALLAVGGLLCLSLAMYSLTRILGIHRTLAYLILVALTVIGTLSYVAVEMIAADLTAALERLDAEERIRVEEVGRLLGKTGADWDGDWQALETIMQSAPAAAQAQISRHRINLARAIQRVDMLASGWIERRVAAQHNLTLPSSFPLTEPEQQAMAEAEASFSPSRLSKVAAWIMLGAGLLGSIILTGIGIRRIKTKRWIENIPTVKTKGVVFGINEIKGKARMPAETDILTGPVSGKPCCLYRYIIKEKRQSGKKTEWHVVSDELKLPTFLCEDAEGTIPVYPQGAELMLRHSSQRREGRRKHIEYYLPVDVPVYVLGSAVIHPETHDRLVLARGEEKALPFIISDYSENELVASKAARGFLSLNFGFSSLMLATFGYAGYQWGFDPATYMTAALAPVFYLILFMLVLLYNDLVYLNWRCGAMWSNIDVALKKRFDLVPQLLASVKGYAAHERGLQESITRMRAEYTEQKPQVASQMLAEEALLLTQFAGQLEQYPDLKANDLVADLFRRIRDLEDEVALMREGYNHAVEVYRNRSERLPDAFLAMFRFPRREFFSFNPESAALRS